MVNNQQIPFISLIIATEDTIMGGPSAGSLGRDLVSTGKMCRASV